MSFLEHWVSLPDSWSRETLGELCDRVSGDVQTGPFGSQLHASDYVEVGVPAVMPTNIKEDRISVEGINYISSEDATRLERYLLAEGDLVLSRRGDVERRALVQFSQSGWLCGTGCLRVRIPGSSVCQRYLYYYFGHPDTRAWITRHAQGATMPNLNTDIVRSIPIALPPLPEQRQIARILGALDDKIELNRRMNRTLEAIAQTLFQAWFVDFEGETDLVDSELGEIPRGWRVAPLPEIVEVNPRRKLEKGAEVPYLEMKNMPTDGARALDWYPRPYKSGTRFMNGDVLVARITPCLENGKTAFVDFLDEGEVAWGSTEYLVLRSKPPLPLEYAYFLARSDRFRRFAIKSMTGSSGRQRVRVSALDHFMVPVPDEATARRFGDFARLAMESFKQRDEESRTLANLRDTLLPKLISGELRVPAARERLEAAGVSGGEASP